MIVELTLIFIIIVLLAGLGIQSHSIKAWRKAHARLYRDVLQLRCERSRLMEAYTNLKWGLKEQIDESPKVCDLMGAPDDRT